jgi:hypothetical protein
LPTVSATARISIAFNRKAFGFDTKSPSPVALNAIGRNSVPGYLSPGAAAPFADRSGRARCLDPAGRFRY